MIHTMQIIDKQADLHLDHITFVLLHSRTVSFIRTPCTHQINPGADHKNRDQNSKRQNQKKTMKI